MEALIAWLLAEAWPYIVTVAGALGVWLLARRTGKQEGQQEARINQLEADRKAAEEARNVEHETAAMDDDAVVRESGKWVRGKRG